MGIPRLACERSRPWSTHALVIASAPSTCCSSSRCWRSLDGPTFGNGNPGAPNAGNGTFTLGTIQRIDGNTITLQTADGSTVTVKVGDDTQIQVTEDGDLKDLAEGSTIAANGTREGDTFDASSISAGGGFTVGGPGAPAG